MAKQRITVLGVPVDICRPEDLEGEIMRIAEKPGHKQVVFLKIWDLIKARSRRSDFGVCLRSADLVLPVSKSIISGARFLKRGTPVRYNPFNATISILSALDQHYKSIFFLGSHKKTLLQAERNVHETFRGLQVVGRYVGYFPRNVEDDVVKAIYKASPSLVLIGDGIKEKNLWSYHRREKFSSSIFLYYHDCLGIFSDRVRRVSEKTFDKGHEIWHEILHYPLKVFLVFPYIYYILALVWFRLFKRGQEELDGAAAQAESADSAYSHVASAEAPAPSGAEENPPQE